MGTAPLLWMLVLLSWDSGRAGGTCAELEPGEKTVVRVGSGESLVYGSVRYQLERLSEKDYRVTLPVEFHVPRRIAKILGTTKREARAAYREYAKGCLKEAGPAFRGPEGERLEITIAESGIPGLRGPSDVAIIGADERSNSSEWEQDISCETVVHEVLHLLGLVDEYTEWSKGFKKGEHGGYRWVEDGAELPAYDCRAHGPWNSVMANQWLAFEDFRSGRNESVLLPAHFRMIVTGNCAARNADYIACGREAYRTSKANRGKGCGEDLPGVCASYEWLQ